MVNGIIFITFVPSNNKTTMKRYKVREVTELLEKDGWYL